jgi:hypothetical protein
MVNWNPFRVGRHFMNRPEVRLGEQSAGIVNFKMRPWIFRPSSSYFVVSDGESSNVTDADVPKFSLWIYETVNNG